MSIDKNTLTQFITKYNLGGSAESVILVVKNKELKTSFITDDKNVAGFLSMQNVDLPDGEYAVYDTARLLSILSVLDTSIATKVNSRADGVPLSIQLKDKTISATYVLADKDNIPHAPTGIKEPDFTLAINITPEFVGTFLKARSALPDVDTFSVFCEKGVMYIALGLVDGINTNAIKIKMDGEAASDMAAVKFSARYLREVLVANKELSSGILYVSSQGLASFIPTLDKITAKYYLVKMD